MGGLLQVNMGHSINYNCANCCVSQTYMCWSFISWPLWLEKAWNSPFHPQKISFVTMKLGWVASISYQRNPGCAEKLISLGVPRVSPAGSCSWEVADPLLFPGVCEIQSVLEEHNLWLNDKYLRYCLPHSNHRANEGLHHVAMKLVMAFKCSGVSIQPCSSLTM